MSCMYFIHAEHSVHHFKWKHAKTDSLPGWVISSGSVLCHDVHQHPEIQSLMNVFIHVYSYILPIHTKSTSHSLSWSRIVLFLSLWPSWPFLYTSTLIPMESLLIQICETAITTTDDGTDPWGIRDLMSLEATLSAEQKKIEKIIRMVFTGNNDCYQHLSTSIDNDWLNVKLN